VVEPAPTPYNGMEYNASEVDQAKAYEMKRTCSGIQAYESLVRILEGRYNLEQYIKMGLI
jgi:hypothetical protein